MKIRAIVNGVCFYTTRAAIKKQTVSDFSLQNTAMYFVLDQMGKSYGFASTVSLYDEKMNRHSFDVQLTKCQ
jgi:hypothetical protein